MERDTTGQPGKMAIADSSSLPWAESQTEYGALSRWRVTFWWLPSAVSPKLYPCGVVLGFLCFWGFLLPQKGSVCSWYLVWGRLVWLSLESWVISSKIISPWAWTPNRSPSHRIKFILFCFILLFFFPYHSGGRHLPQSLDISNCQTPRFWMCQQEENTWCWVLSSVC